MVNKTVNKFDRFTKKGPTNTSENVPYAFSHLAAGAPPSVYMSMATGNTFDEAMQETNNIPMPEDDLGMDMELDIDLALDPELDDPDAIEKAIYQLRIAEEKEIEPEEVLNTPYGPGLSGEEIDLLLDAYPALDAGVDLDMIDENFDELDRILNTSGESIEAAMDAAEQRAEDEGEIEASPAMLRQLGDNFGNSVEAMVNPRNPYEAMLGDSFHEKNFEELSEETVRLLGNNQQNTGEDLILKMIQGSSPNEVVAQLKELNIPNLQSYIDNWLTSAPSGIGQAYLDALRTYVSQGKVPIDPGLQPKAQASTPAATANVGDEGLGIQYMPSGVGSYGLSPDIGRGGQDIPGVVADSEKDLFEDDKSKLPEEVDTEILVNENLTKAFYTTMYSYPNAGRSDVRDRLPYIFNDTRTLFFLYKGNDMFLTIKGLDGVIDKKGQTDLLQPMEAGYKSFLADYLKDPISIRTGEAFRNNLALVASTLAYAADNPDQTRWSTEFESRHTWVDGMFGATGADFADKNRRNLIKMAATQGGQGYYSSLIHKSVDRVMDYYENIGWTDEDIFEKMTELTGVPWVDPGNKGGATKIEKVADIIEENKQKEIDASMAGGPPGTTPGTTPGTPPATPPGPGVEGDGTEEWFKTIADMNLEQIPTEDETKTVIIDPAVEAARRARLALAQAGDYDARQEGMTTNVPLPSDTADWYRPASEIRDQSAVSQAEAYDAEQEGMTTGVPLPTDTAYWYQPEATRRAWDAEQAGDYESGADMIDALQRERPAPGGFSARQIAERHQIHGPQPVEYQDPFEMDAPGGRISSWEDYAAQQALEESRYDQWQQPVSPWDWSGGPPGPPMGEPPPQRYDGAYDFFQELQDRGRTAPNVSSYPVNLGSPPSGMLPGYSGPPGLYDDFKTWPRYDPNETRYPYHVGISAPATLPAYSTGSPADFADFSALSQASIPPGVPLSQQQIDRMDPALLEALLTGGTLDQRRLRPL